jgi:hypothetical protein
MVNPRNEKTAGRILTDIGTPYNNDLAISFAMVIAISVDSRHSLITLLWFHQRQTTLILPS